MSARRIARELAVIVMPQLPKEHQKLTKLEVDDLVARAVHMLSDYAKQSLADANAILERASKDIVDIEVEHPDNARNVDKLEPVQLTSAQLKEQIQKIDRALHLVAEALDVPDMVLHGGRNLLEVNCSKCSHVNQVHIERPNQSEVRDFMYELINTYQGHKAEIDDFIRYAKSKWQIQRMVSIDRDILRLACAEAFFMPDIPIRVAISEAVELCHRFADEQAAKFINGILGDLSDEAKHFRNKGEFLSIGQQIEDSAADAEAPLDEPVTNPFK